MSHNLEDEKHLEKDVHLEVLGVTADLDLGPDGIRKSAFDKIGAWEAVKLFRWAAFYCCTAYTMSMLDGWSVSRVQARRGHELTR